MVVAGLLVVAGLMVVALVLVVGALGVRLVDELAGGERPGARVAAREARLDDALVAVLQVGGVALAVAVVVGDLDAGGGEVEDDRLADEAGAADGLVALQDLHAVGAPGALEDVGDLLGAVLELVPRLVVGVLL